MQFNVLVTLHGHKKQKEKCHAWENDLLDRQSKVYDFQCCICAKAKQSLMLLEIIGPSF